MRDLGAELVPPGDDPLPEEQHLRFLDHLAGMCARTWGWHDDDVGLLPYAARWAWFGHAAIDVERALGWRGAGAGDRRRRLGALRRAGTGRRVRRRGRAAT